MYDINNSIDNNNNDIKYNKSYINKYLLKLPGFIKITNIKIVCYLFLWYFFTVVYNISNKRLLNDLPLPITIATLQLLLGIPIFIPIWLFKPIKYDSTNWVSHSIIALMHGLGNLSSVISFHSGSVSFSHVIKALEPVVAAILSVLILHDVFPMIVYISLIPIVTGVGIASMKELSFTWLGFTCAMLSNVFYQMRMVLAKLQISNTSNNNKLSSANLFRIITIYASIQLIPIALLFEGYAIINICKSLTSGGMISSNQLSINHSITSNLLISGFSYYMYNEVAFWLLDMIHPITHAVANSIKRIVIILVSIVIFKTPINSLGMFGSIIAVFGTVIYSIAQHKYKSNNEIKPNR